MDGALYSVEVGLLKVALRSLLAQVAQGDAYATGIRLEWDAADEMSVELLDADGSPVGGFAL
jgi:hypothetical protein